MNKDEIKTIEENENEMIKRLQSALPDMETMRFNFDKIDLATYLYDTGCRIVGEDEIVIKKSEYDILLKDYTTTYGNAYKWGLKVGEEKTAIEILQELYDEAMRYTNEVVELTAFEIKQLAKEKGIELED